MFHPRLPRISESQRYSEELTQQAEETENRIHSLLRQLEGGFIRNDELTVLKGSVEYLMGSYFEQHEDLEAEMSSMLDDLKRGLLTQEELESMLRIDQYRGGLISKMAFSLKGQLESLFTKFTTVLKDIYDKGEFPVDQVTGLFTDMTSVLNSVDFMTKVIRIPMKNLNIPEVQTSLRLQVESVRSIDQQSKSSGAISSPKSKRMTLQETMQELSGAMNTGPLSTDRSKNSKTTSTTSEQVENSGSKAEKVSRSHHQKRKHSRTSDMSFDTVPTAVIQVMIKVDGSTQTDEIDWSPYMNLGMEAKKSKDSSTEKGSSKKQSVKSQSTYETVEPTDFNKKDIVPLVEVGKKQSDQGLLAKKFQATQTKTVAKSAVVSNQLLNDAKDGRPPSRPSIESRSQSAGQPASKTNMIGWPKKKKRTSSESTSRPSSASEASDDDIRDPAADILGASMRGTYSDLSNLSKADNMDQIMNEKTFIKSSKPAKKKKHGIAIKDENKYLVDISRIKSSSPSIPSTTGILSPKLSSDSTDNLDLSGRSSPNEKNKSNESRAYQYDHIKVSKTHKETIPSHRMTASNISALDACGKTGLLDQRYLKSLNDDDFDVGEGSQESLGSNAMTDSFVFSNSMSQSIGSSNDFHDQSNVLPSLHVPPRKSISHYVDNHMNQSKKYQKSMKEMKHDSILRKVSGIIVDLDQVIMIDPEEYHEIDIENQHEFLTEQQDRGHMMLLHDYQQLIRDVTENDIENIQSFQNLPTKEKVRVVKSSKYMSKHSNRSKKSSPQRKPSCHGYEMKNFVVPDIFTNKPTLTTNQSITMNTNQNQPVVKFHDIDQSKNELKALNENRPQSGSLNMSISPVKSHHNTNDVSLRYHHHDQQLVNIDSISSNVQTELKTDHVINQEIIYIVPPCRKDKNIDTDDFEQYLVATQQMDPIDVESVTSNHYQSFSKSKDNIKLDDSDENSIFSKLSDTITPSSLSHQYSHVLSAPLRGQIANSGKNNNSFIANPYKKYAVMFGLMNHDIKRSIYSTPKKLNSKLINPPEPLDASSHPIGQSYSLVDIYNQYQSKLSDLDKIRLHSIANTTQEIDKQSNELLNQLFAKIHPSLELINLISTKTITIINKIQKISSDLIIIICSDENPNQTEYKGAAKQMFKFFGEVEIAKLWLDLQLLQYRSVFESLVLLGMNTNNILQDQNQEFHVIYKLFIACQGKVVDIHHRYTTIRERCNRYNILSDHYQFFQDQANHIVNDDHDELILRQLLNQLKPTSMANDVNQNSSIGNHDSILISQYEKKFKELNQQIEELKEDNQYLKDEYIQLSIQKSSPTITSVLSFYCTLSDKNYIPTIKQLLLQFHHLKQFLDHNDSHMDFITLRRRLQVCLSTIPTIDRFIHKFNLLYNQWIHERLQVFNQRNLIGGNADQTLFCPICHNANELKPVRSSLLSRQVQSRNANMRKSLCATAISKHRERIESKQLNRIVNEDLKRPLTDSDMSINPRHPFSSKHPNLIHSPLSDEIKEDLKIVDMFPISLDTDSYPKTNSVDEFVYEGYLPADTSATTPRLDGLATSIHLEYNPGNHSNPISISRRNSYQSKDVSLSGKIQNRSNSESTGAIQGLNAQESIRKKSIHLECTLPNMNALQLSPVSAELGSLAGSATTAT